MVLELVTNIANDTEIDFQRLEHCLFIRRSFSVGGLKTANLLNVPPGQNLQISSP